LDIYDNLYFKDGRLLIHGQNESGKSTILESIHYALYGMPLRPSKNAGNDDIICYGRDKALVELEFSIDETIYQVRRELLRNKTNIHILNKREKSGSLSRVTTGARNVNDAISDILHGIDSEALLNSCLVEQKELGKLEAASRQDRIKAMSSLLNLEAFVDAKEDIKKECGELEKIHLKTVNKLNEAKKSKEEYEDSYEERLSAEKRLKEIFEEKKNVQDILEKTRKKLEIIQNMKKHQTKINENQYRIEGLFKELKLLEEQLSDIEKTEKEITLIEQKIPEEREKLERVNKQIETIQRLSNLNEKQKEINSSAENIQIKFNENKRNYDEALNAKKKIQELEEKIKIYKPVKKAFKEIEEISLLFNNLVGYNNEIKRVKEEIESVQNLIYEQKDSENKIMLLEEREKQTHKKREQKQQIRTGGIVAASVGSLILLYNLYSLNWIGGAIGAIILASGAYLIVKNNPNEIESELNTIRVQRYELMGEKARLKDYQETIKKYINQLRELESKKSNLDEAIISELNHLPEQPREYKSVVILTNLQTVKNLRNQIQEDNETYTRLTTEKESLKEKADSVEQLSSSLESIKTEKITLENESDKIINQIEEIEKKTGITRKDEDVIRGKYNETSSILTELLTKKRQYQSNLKRKPLLQEKIIEISNEINIHKATIQKEEKILQSLEEHGVKTEDEIKLNEERDAYLSKSAQLKQEEKERINDVNKAINVMEKTKELREQYPVLVDEAEREEFRLESMRRATILLDTTRDSIMSSVKQNVEKIMMQFLPTLTDNRYNMVRIDETNYRIEVYDKEAKMWRGKGVFSGATQDQFSLALRLAFAISTIPSSRGARPGFIFLDEPLSGFDAQRRRGFIKLLQEDLSRHFDQIIVISHLEALTEEFHDSLILDSGNIIEVQR
jgi:exonuclease SbcC